MTYSVVARDKKTGQLGIAVQTHWFGVGNNVPWLEAGVGAVATQAQTNMDYGKKGLQLMSSGKTLEQAFDEISNTDESLGMRQVAMIDNEGNVVTHTGDGCLKYADHIVGDGFIVQGNLLSNDAVLPAMKKAYEDNIDNDFAVRLMLALHAGQDAGGELRGQQSAALRIVPGTKDEYDIINLRIDNDEKPLEKMGGQLDICVAYKTLMQAEDLSDAGKLDESLQLFDKVFRILGDSEEALFWKAFALYNNDRKEEAEEIFNKFPENSKWAELRKRIS